MSIAVKYALYYCILVMALLLVTPPDASGALIINEIMADPASDWDGDGAYSYRDDEWIEVRNTGPEALDLSGYFLRDITDDTPHLQLEGILDPGGIMIFYGSNAVIWQQASGVTVSGFSLNNTGDTVELLQGDGTVFEVVDSVTYGDHEAEDDRSCGPDLETGQWLLFDGLNPHTGDQEPLGTGCEPTPGLPNACAPQVPVRLAAWDRVKSLYR
jgi:hypothetical protein